MLSPEPTWYSAANRILETLYYLSGIALAVLAAFGLRQIRITSEQLRLTREIAESSKRREAVKLAAVQCTFFADTVLPRLEALDAQCDASRITCFDSPRQEPHITLTVPKLELPPRTFDLKTLEPIWEQIGGVAANCLNSFESFAMPFAAGVADDAVGFQEASALFCDSIRRFLPLIWHIRSTQDARYPSALALYCNWENRRRAEKVAPILKDMQALTDSVDKNKIEPI
jgi:hypothetical protein